MCQQLVQRIWAIASIESFFCILNDLANPKNGLNLVLNPLFDFPLKNLILVKKINVHAAATAPSRGTLPASSKNER